jgi:MoxR-like ATPase
MIFLKSYFAKGDILLRPLAGQVLKDGSPIRGESLVHSDEVLKTRHGMGSIFVVDNLVPRSASTYNVVGTMKVVNLAATITERASDEAFDALSKLLDDKAPATSAEKVEKKAMPKGKTFLEKIISNVKYSPPTIEDDGFYVNPDLWYLLVRNIIGQTNTLLLGPTGTGKTELVQLICTKAKLSYSWYDMGAMIDPIPSLLGTHRLQAGKSIFDYAAFTQAIRKPGVILFDELSRPSPVTTNILLPCLDNRRTLKVEIAGGKDVRDIAIHEQCSFVATANIGSQYTGTTQMDRALTGRFFTIEVNYMEAKHEIAVLQTRTNISTTDAAKLVAAANDVRTQHGKGELSDTISTRETLMAAEMVRDGYPVLKALESCYLPLFEGTKSEGERSIVSKMLMTR